MAAYGVNYGGGLPCVWLRCSFPDRTKAKAIKGARWHPDDKVWYWPLVHKGDEVRLVRAIREQFPAVTFDSGSAALSRPQAKQLPPVGESLETLIPDKLPVYPWRRQPYAHQRLGVAASLLRDRLLILYEQGLGKTATAIDAACLSLSQGKVQRVYIVCPENLRQTWVDEIAAVAWIDPDGVAVVRDNPSKLSGKRIRGLTDPQHRQRMIQKRATWTIIGYTSATLEAKKLAPLVEGQFLIVDELQGLKNPQAKRTKAVLDFHPRKFIGMTGTPVVNTPGDAFPAADFCDKGIFGKSFYDFRDHFIVIKPIKTANGVVDMEVGYKNLPDAHQRLLSIGLRKRKEDCLDLPPKVRERHYCEMSQKQEQVYIDILGAIGDDLKTIRQKNDGKVPLPDLLWQMVRLQQVADGFYPDPDFPDHLIWIEDAAKFVVADELVEQAVAEGRKVVLWTRFVPLARKLAERYSKFNANYLAGEVPMDKREEYQTLFKTRDDHQVLVLTMGVGGLGLNLQCADTEIFIDRWYNPAVNVQCEDRCHRSGQTSTVTIHVLLAEDTLDIHTDAILKKKETLMDQMVDGNFPETLPDGSLFDAEFFAKVFGQKNKEVTPE